MDDHEHRSKKSISPGASENTKNLTGNEKLSALIDRAHSVNFLQLVAGLSQVLLGIAVLTVSLLGLIQPFWLSTVLSIMSSVTIMIGTYFCYSAIAVLDTDTLIRDAMRRIVEDQN